MSNRALRRAANVAALFAVPVVLFAVLALRSETRRPAHDNEPRPSPNPIVEAPVDEPAYPREATAPTAPATTAPTAPENVEDDFMRLMRSARGKDPKLVVALAREGNRRFPNSPAAAERTSLLIHALAEQGLASDARGEAEDMVNRFPDSAWVQEVERFTGAHRHRNLRVNAEGRLEAFDPPG